MAGCSRGVGHGKQVGVEKKRRGSAMSCRSNITTLPQGVEGHLQGPPRDRKKDGEMEQSEGRMKRTNDE